ncbi:putative ribosomal protein L53 [Helianthus debilis subsp. tardiflorus]
MNNNTEKPLLLDKPYFFLSFPSIHCSLDPSSSLVRLHHLLLFHFYAPKKLTLSNQTLSMLKFLSKVKIEFNALDPRTAACMEFLAQCNARTAKESNPSCQLLVKRRTDSYPPQISVTFVNGVEEVFDATSTPAQTIRKMILEKGQQLETEQMFCEAGEKWPVIIPAEEIHQSFPGTKPRKAEEKKQ